MSNARPCGKCPKRDGNGICVVRAKWMSPIHPSCAYGRKQMYNAYMAEYLRNYRTKKGADGK